MLRWIAFLLTFTFLMAGTTLAQEQKLPLLFEDDFEKGADRWEPGDPQAWRISQKAGSKVFEQYQQSKVKTPHRSPFNYALARDLVVGDFVLTAKVLSTAKDGAHRDMCLFWGWQDPAHHYYVHISKQMDDRAHQIFIVDGKDRVKISKTTTKGVIWGDGWHQVKIVRTVADGAITAYFDDMSTPIMTAVDRTFTWGRVGIGSFDDTGMYDDIKIHGNRVEKK